MPEEPEKSVSNERAFHLYAEYLHPAFKQIEDLMYKLNNEAIRNKEDAESWKKQAMHYHKYVVESMFHKINEADDNVVAMPVEEAVPSLRNCDIITEPDALHAAFIKYCDDCNAGCPMGCVYRKDQRFVFKENVASMFKCFARFVLEKSKEANK